MGNNMVSSSLSALGRFFHQILDPLNPNQAKFVLSEARKNIHVLQELANPKTVSDYECEEAWELRKQVVYYFNVLLTRLHSLRTTLWTSLDELNHFFESFKNAFIGFGGDHQIWPSYLKSYTGHRDGNEVSFFI